MTSTMTLASALHYLHTHGVIVPLAQNIADIYHAEIRKAHSLALTKAETLLLESLPPGTPIEEIRAVAIELLPPLTLD